MPAEAFSVLVGQLFGEHSVELKSNFDWSGKITLSRRVSHLRLVSAYGKFSSLFTQRRLGNLVDKCIHWKAKAES